MRPDLPSLEVLHAMAVPRVHPNGFVQLDLDELHRLHVWHPRLPYRQATYSPVHDHIFGFDSFVYSGRLVHVVYDLADDPAGTHERWQVQAIGDGESTVLAPLDGRPKRLVPRSAEIVQPGDQYHFPAYEFHETLSNEPTLTIMRKVDFEGAHVGANCQGASVMVPLGDKPDNDFRRDAFDADVLWDLIEEALP